MGKAVFITGTDTGAGKTALTGLLLAHLRASGVHALAMKPFCSGSRDDARLLFELSNREIPIEALNPFYFPKPLAPLVAARLARRHVSFQETIAKICELQKNCEILLIEGVGGLFVPLGENFMVSDLIARLRCSVLLAARNGIGVINHVLLSTSAITSLGTIHTTVVLMGKSDPDISCQSNSEVLRELLRHTDVFEVPFLSEDLHSADVIRAQATSREGLLSQIVRARAFRRAFQGIQASKKSFTGC